MEQVYYLMCLVILRVVSLLENEFILHRKAKRWGRIPKKQDIGSVLDNICVDIMRYILNMVLTEDCDLGEERE